MVVARKSNDQTPHVSMFSKKSSELGLKVCQIGSIGFLSMIRIPLSFFTRTYVIREHEIRKNGNYTLCVCLSYLHNFYKLSLYTY